MRILAIDQGTSATKAAVVDEDGFILSLAEVAIRPIYGAGGLVEQDPIALRESVLEAGARAVQSAGGGIDAVALANQGETVLAWDPSTGAPLTPAIVWQDGRAQGICDEVSQHGERLAARTGLVLDPYFSAPKMAWIRRHLTTDGIVTTTDAWLVHTLTGEIASDVTTASRSLVLDLDHREWDRDLLAVFGLADERLPRLVSCDEIVGSTGAFGTEAALTGLIVDQQAALFAEGCTVPGMAKCTYGTGAFLLANVGGSGQRSRHGLTTSVAWQTANRTDYCMDGQVYTAASAVRWLIDLGILASAGDIDTAASADATGVLFVPALAGLASPWWRSDATASFVGLTLATDSGQLVRAVMEGIAAQVAELVLVMATDAGTPIRSLRVDGGMTNSQVLMQAQADLLQVPVEVYPSAHATALGAAAMARLALQSDMTLDQAVWWWEPERVYEPAWSADRAGSFMDAWRRALQVHLPEPR